MSADSLTEPIDLTGQVAIVTGGGRGIGRAIAQALAGAGAAVAVVARSHAELDEAVCSIEESGGRAVACPADVTDRHAVEEAVKQTEQQLGPPDLLVNNAGIFRCFGYTWEVDPEEWWRVIEVNLRGPFLFARQVLPGMLARGSGRIINLASGAGLVTHRGLLAYCISKAAVIRFTDGLAVETRGQGVAVFAMDPGTVRTPMNARADELMSEYVSAIPESARAEHPIARLIAAFRRIFEEGHDTPIGRSVQLALLLASGKADPLSGRFVSAWGGLADVTEMLQHVEEIQEKDLYTLRLRK